MIHPVDYLHEQLSQFGDYPVGLVAVPPDLIRGLAFFPGGAGLWVESAEDLLPPMPIGGTMIVGNNFHNVKGFERSRKESGENSKKNPTWRNLIRFICQTGLKKEECFFTNAYMGLLTSDSALGQSPGARDINFRARCVKFLGEQIKVVQPRLILTLGNHVPPVLAELSPDLSSWAGINKVTTLDTFGASLVYPVKFEGVKNPVVIVALTHPSQRNLNVKRRFYNGLAGEEAESALIKAAINFLQK